MIFKVDRKSSEIKVYSASWTPKELEVEKFLLPERNSDEHILNPEVFKEDLLFVKNQARTKRGKRADILALDKAGNGVIIELKKDAGQLGVETQALQYLAAFSSYQGKNFIRHFGMVP
jgi:RecB family endonuclease NucS